MPGHAVADGRPRRIAGRYAILGELGRGGMGIVWLAEDTTIGRHVAIKELHLPDGVSPEERAVFEERVLREARTAGRLNDPAVVTVHDVVQEAGTTNIVMELIQAPTLAAVVRDRGPLPQDQVARLADQLLSALETAHRAGIVHRDVKPSNIMLAANGRAKLTDFGIAQSVDDPRLTTSGLLIGSPAYLSPERLRGEEASAASDLWALGAVLFFAVEGYSPFERANTAATMHAILNEVPYLTRGQGALASVITGLLISSPQARLTAGQVRGLLSHVQQTNTGPTSVYQPGPPTSYAPAPKRRKLPWQLVLSLAMVLVVLGGVAGYLLNQAMTAPADDVPQADSFTYGSGGDILEFGVSNGYCATGALQKNAAFASGNCDKPFTVQTFGYLQLDDELDYLPERLTDLGKDYCLWLFGTNRVDSAKRPALKPTALIPSQESWETSRGDGGSQTVTCVLSAKSGELLTGTQLGEDD